MEIRRNSEGNMLFIDAKELVNSCIEHGVIHGIVNDHAFVYHQAGENIPEGWYKYEINDLVHIVMEQDDVIQFLADSLQEKTGVEFRPSFDICFFNWCKENVFPYIC